VTTHYSNRERWGTRIGIVLAMSANAVGLGNFLRFPVQCAANGGGAFMIPYFVAFLLLGISLMWMEWGIGRFGGKYGHGTTPGMFHYLWKHPMAKYLGAIGVTIPFALVLYYTLIVSWTLAYSFFSLTGQYIGIENHQEMADFLAGFQGIESNSFFSGITTTFLFYCLTLGTMTFFLIRGIKYGIEMLAKVSIPLILIIGAGLVIRVVTLGTPDPAFPENNIANGFGYVWNPDFSILSQSKVWLAATGQIFFTLSVGFGAIQTFASYLGPKDDVILSGLGTSATNGFAEVVLGGSIAIPVTFAFFGLTQTQEIAAGGAFDLGFVAMPIIFQKMAFGQFFGTLWFFLLFLAGLTSSVAMAQPMMAFLQEEFKLKRKTAALIIGSSAFILTLPIIFFLKNGFLNEMDFWIGTLGLVVFAVIEVILFVWVFGAKNAWREMVAGSQIKLSKFFFPVMKYVTPAYLFILLAVWFFQDGLDVLVMKNVTEENYPFIWGARFLLVAIFVTILILVRIAWQKPHLIQRRVPK